MALLIQMRQRIKAIESIKKITHAMRLVAMSGHSKLKNKERLINSYAHQTKDIFEKLYSLAPVHTGPLVSAKQMPANRPLVIVVGSQKGLCGNFNAALFTLIEKKLSAAQDIHFIAVGKRAADYLKEHQESTRIIGDFSTFTPSTVKQTTGKLTRLIMDAYPEYSSVIMYSNKLVTFFVQQPVVTQILPFAQEEASTPQNHYDEYVWEQVPQELLRTAAHLHLEAEIYNLLFQSLLAEQAARFISMDSSTRNAESLLELTKLQYNKLRQAKITKEIIELASIDLAR